MTPSLVLDDFMKSHGYKFQLKQIDKNIDKIVEDYDIWLKIDITIRRLGVKVDHKWWWVNIGKLYSVRSKTKRKVYKTRKIREASEGRRYFDPSIGEKLGGQEEKMGL